MIKGMTGFGSAPLNAGKVKGVVELKTVNHRYFDAAFYLPIGFGSVEHRLRQMVNKEVKRGRVTISVKLTQKPTQSLLFNEEAVEQYLKYEKKLKRKFGVDNGITAGDIIRLPGVIETKEVFIDGQELWPALEKAVKRALKGLMTMRKREGKSLMQDISNQAKRMMLQINKIKARAKVIAREKKKKLTPEEYVSFQKGADINEELERLAHYIDETKALLRSTISTGKKMDFIAQEMQRETNTIGSKLQDKIVTNAVIALKSKIEKIREQSQNIE